MADSPRRAISPDDALPPVEPPSAGFLVQLFLVPAIIVGIIVCVWVAFHWLAQLGNDPQAAVRSLRRNTEGRWQAALNLANDLRGPGGAKLKADEALAGELASILGDEVKSGRPVGGGHSAEQSRTLCVYLCRALGEFAVPEAAPRGRAGHDARARAGIPQDDREIRGNPGQSPRDSPAQRSSTPASAKPLRRSWHESQRPQARAPAGS